METSRKTPIELFGIECQEGWNSIVLPLIEMCKANDMEIFQIKEKFGGLRFYTSGGPEWAMDLIDLMEGLSFHICEDCGRDGECLSFNGWYRTLCPVCKSAYEK